uniref:Uncharacterized protein n=1 Tax=Anopheles melas TaxID=34690 RepID=A0A182UA73_9DIPT
MECARAASSCCTLRSRSGVRARAIGDRAPPWGFSLGLSAPSGRWMLPLSETGVVEGDGGVIPFCSTIIGEETVGGVGGDVASGRDGGSVAEVASDGGSGGAVTSISLPSYLDS